MTKKKKPRLRHRTDQTYKRKTDTRDERIPTIDKDKVVFNFKDFLGNQPEGNEQSFETWQTEGILSRLLKKLIHISGLTIQEAKQQNIITEYGRFLGKSDFKCPKKFEPGVRWSVIKKITGQKGRIVGHIVDNIFFVVFLDKDHQFWKTEKKNT